MLYVMNSENLRRIVKLKPDLHLFLLLYLRLHLKAHLSTSSVPMRGKAVLRIILELRS